jgi:cytochrome c
MKLTPYLTISSLALMIFLSPAHADKNLAMKSGCLGCHKADAKLVGPSFQEIAGRYTAQPDIVDRLADKVKNGSPAGESLLWGNVPMPPNPSAPEDIRTVIRWMLAEGAK